MNNCQEDHTPPEEGGRDFCPKCNLSLKPKDYVMGDKKQENNWHEVTFEKEDEICIYCGGINEHENDCDGKTIRPMSFHQI